MHISQEECVGCRKCVPYCPRDAIQIEQREAIIDSDACAECGVRLKNTGYPRDTVYNIYLEAPRAYREAFSDPFGKHEGTTLKHTGRGTEEVKTNNVTGVVHSPDTITFTVELGRPGIGSAFHDLQTILQTVAPCAEAFEINNPVTSLTIDREKGLFDLSALDEPVVSAIVGFSCRLDHIASVLRALKEASQHIDTAFSPCIVCRVDERDNSLPVINMIKELGLDLHAASAKTNLGLGKPYHKGRTKEGSAAL